MDYLITIRISEQGASANLTSEAVDAIKTALSQHVDITGVSVVEVTATLDHEEV